MARVKQVKARKDYPQYGIQKGETCYVWSIRAHPAARGQTFRSKTYPKPSQLTTSPFLKTRYGIEECLSAWTLDDVTTDIRDEIAQEIRDLGAEAQESFENMPEGLQQGDTGQMLEERAQSCEEWADAIEQVDIPERTVEEEPNEENEEEYKEWEEQQEALQNALDELQACDYPG